MYSNKDLAKPFSHDAFKRECPSHTVLETLSSKWVYLLICALRGGRMRYSDLQRKIDGVSPKMLTQTLRRLEQDGLLQRTVYASVPPRVEYELSELGWKLSGLMEQIRGWAEAHAPQITAARLAFEDRQDKETNGG